MGGWARTRLTAGVKPMRPSAYGRRLRFTYAFGTMSGPTIDWRHIACAALIIALPIAGVAAQPESEPSSPPARASGASVAPLDELGRGTPRGTVAGFLEETSAHRYRRAAAYLDLRRIPTQEATDRGADLARQLRVALEHTVLDVDALSDDPEGRQEPGLPRTRQLVARIESEHGPASILLERVRRDDGVLIWQFSQATVASIPNLYWTFSYGMVGQWLPPVLVETRFLGLAAWQWLGLAVLVGVAFLIAHLIVRPAMPLTRWLLVRWGMKLEDPSLGRAVGPIRLLVALAVFRAGRTALWLPASVLPFVTGVERFLLIIVLAWFALRLVELTSLAARRRLLSRHETATVPIVAADRRAR